MLTALAGVPALIVFAVVRLWIARAKMKNLGVIFASVSLSAAIMWIGFGEPYWRLLSKKAEYDAFAATHPQDEVIVFDWARRWTHSLRLVQRIPGAVSIPECNKRA